MALENKDMNEKETNYLPTTLTTGINKTETKIETNPNTKSDVRAYQVSFEGTESDQEEEIVVQTTKKTGIKDIKIETIRNRVDQEERYKAYVKNTSIKQATSFDNCIEE